MIKPLPKPLPGYHIRVWLQTEAWARGHSFHNIIDDECCPDFSCCVPDLFETDEAKRRDYFKRHFPEELENK